MKDFKPINKSKIISIKLSKLISYQLFGEEIEKETKLKYKLNVEKGKLILEIEKDEKN